MPTVDELMEMFDPRDAYQLTRVVERRKPESTDWNVPFCPMTQTLDREIELHVRIGYGLGMAPFKADNAATPIAPAKGDVQRQLLELVTISEKDVLRATDLIRLESADPRMRMMGIRDVLERTTALRVRNTNRAKWMAWQAVRGQLPIQYPDGATITVDWDLAGGVFNTHFTGSHVPSAGVRWDHQDANGAYDVDIIEDTYNWAKLIADDAGVDEAEVTMHVNSTTLRVIRKNAAVNAALSPTQPRVLTATRQEIAEILGVKEIAVVNDAYWTTSNVKTKYLPDGVALFTGPYTMPDGAPIMEMKDGPVARVTGPGSITVSPNPGMQAEMYIDPEAVVQNMRVTTARMAVLNHPEAVVWATLWS